MTRQRCIARAAFTLIEVTLVLAVMMLIVGLTWPLLSRPLAFERLKSAGDQVMAEWSTARVEAMRTGENCIFQFNEGTGSYGIAIGASGSTASLSLKLPDDIVFVGGEKAEDVREMSEGGSGDARAAEVWFYPDGTSSEVRELLLKNEYGAQIRLVLRGLTGIARVEEDVPDAADASLPTGAQR